MVARIIAEDEVGPKGAVGPQASLVTQPSLRSARVGSSASTRSQDLMVPSEDPDVNRDPSG